MQQALRISTNRRHLIMEDGEPFFWMGDTAWNILQLRREDVEFYLRTRAEQGFTVILCVILVEDLDKGNVYSKRPLRRNEEGQYDPSLPNLAEEGEYGYWDHVDYIVNKAAEYGLYVGLLPAWGDKFNHLWGLGPEILKPGNATAYGEWLGNRYRDQPNIIWVLGGDRTVSNRRHYAVIHNMAEALRQESGGAQLITFHPNGEYSSSLYWHEEDWLDFNMLQSSHYRLHHPNDEMIASDYLREPAKPVLDAEPCYEDHPIGFKPENGWFDDKDVRHAAYWALFAGAFGHTYGHHSVWSFTEEPTDYFIMSWKVALARPGAQQMAHIKRLMISRPMLVRVPDQTLLAANPPGAGRQRACRGADYAFIYTPNGLPIDCQLGRISGSTVIASWFNPRSGETVPAGSFANTGQRRFVPPSCGRRDDWVLILDAAQQR
ncbi:glycoside hydrolase family 140 protein [Paenibacillus albus]|uniref:DUF4038 domain-containing protein n=1 Tax=Paenibacillus albus TaxID=2495582 RepID=A0A3S9A6J9_9BACL|nr:glycoside hydrolase family 140 protein [Paenibacillus albus]AZN41331.1 DUF4038 domain-containing protein [Paenibacillus albus]